MTAINDSFLLECSIYKLLKRHFRSRSYYVDLLELFLEVGSSCWGPSAQILVVAVRSPPFCRDCVVLFLRALDADDISDCSRAAT